MRICLSSEDSDDIFGSAGAHRRPSGLSSVGLFGTTFEDFHRHVLCCAVCTCKAGLPPILTDIYLQILLTVPLSVDSCPSAYSYPLCLQFPFVLTVTLCDYSCTFCLQLPCLLIVAISACSSPFCLQFPFLLTVALSACSCPFCFQLP
jgi:hypothetical protein